MEKRPAPQVPAHRRPLHTDRKTTSAHSKVPIDQATAGKRYRVRDKDWAALHGEELSWEDANRLKDKVVASGKSRTARVEDMEVPPLAGWQSEYVGEVEADSLAIEPGTYEAPADCALSPSMPSFDLANDQAVEIPCAGVIKRIPAGHELLVDGVRQEVPCSVAKGVTVQARALDLLMAAARAAALGAAAHSAKAAQARSNAYRDKTVRANAPRKGPPPRDKTATQEVYIRLGNAPVDAAVPPPSPLKVATVQDGAPLPADAITDTDLPDVAGDLGGAATDADLEHAKKQQAG